MPGTQAGPVAAAPNGVAIGEAELERARKAYRGAFEAARAWRSFSPHSRHHDVAYWTLLTSLFSDPGMNRTWLIDRVVAGAGVSRSTAERAVRDARACGLILARQAGAEVRFSLSPAMFEHCVDYFRNWMDVEKLGRALGYGDDYTG